ncbi:laminin-like protein epi-1 isoform X2 [Mytilus trossulus]|uniref:laminin-like protein epi-1 isoform X2 n=1 Tax=Mytilus trossulus TaxID=6551 RepID=UPI0030046499
MAVWEVIPLLILLLFLNKTVLVFTQEQFLTPPYFNLAQSQEIIASATCGVGVSGRELFCKLTGATGEYGNRFSPTNEVTIMEGQNCDLCEVPSSEGTIRSTKEHPAEFAIDGTERWWQSPPLSRDLKYNEVNLTINLGQEFHVAYIFIKMANSPRPGVWALERSLDFGKTFQPWQYFADTPSDCIKFFNTPADQEIAEDDSVICTTEFSKIVPLENGEIVVSLVNNRPNAKNFTFSEKLQDWTQATNVRLRLLRTKTLLGHLMAVARQDPTVTRRYFYSIKDISLGGRCVCNGHAESCDRDPNNPRLLTCKCQHNTCGEQCNTCCPGFVQKSWMPAKAGHPFVCEPCECYGHTNDCLYDAEIDRLKQSVDVYGDYVGGGVCQNCRDHTEGTNCDKCVAGFYRPAGVDKAARDACRPCVCDLKFSTGDCEEETGRCKCRPEYVGQDCDRCNIGFYGYPDCIPCDCDFYGTDGNICTVGSVGGGQCPCKQNFDGQKCDMCLLGFYNFPDCIACECDTRGSRSNVCDVTTGQCSCEANYNGKNCNECADGYYDFPSCTLCDCDQSGAHPEICDKVTGQCLCQDNFVEPRCDSCKPSFYRYPICEACNCNAVGSNSEVCELGSGQCPCGLNFAGLRCEHCAAGYYRYPDCSPCNCDRYGSYRQSCDQISGQCECRDTFEGLTCSRCRENFFNFPKCEACNCNPAGAMEVPGYPLGGCGQVPVGQLCECKENVRGHICDECKPGYYGLDRNNPQGCRPCDCHVPGTASGLHVCDPGSGQCVCKVSVRGQRCDVCQDGFHSLDRENSFGCVACNCDTGGSMSHVCNKRTGQCPCKPRVQGLKCQSPTDLHYIPSLHQFIYEIEDGYTPDGSRIRYGFDETIFPDFSWRGYAILNYVQPEVIIDLQIRKPSLYRIIYRYLNPSDQSITGEVMLKPQQAEINTPQMSQVLFPPNDNPSFVTVGSGGSMHDFVLDPGNWMVSLKSSENVMLDYMVLIPQAYYEATVLSEDVTRPCTIPNDGGPCVLYNYTDIANFPTVFGENGYILDVDGNKTPTNVFTDVVITNELGLNALGQLDKNQKDLNLNLAVPNPGDYVLVLNYFTFANNSQNLDVKVTTGDEDYDGDVVIYRCQYSVLCRQVITDVNGMPMVVNIKDNADILLTGDDNVNVAIGSVTAIPYEQWSHGFIRPQIICIRINGICITSRYFIPVGSVRIDFEEPPNEDLKVDRFNFPKGLYEVDPNIGLVRLDQQQTNITIEGMIRDPGRFFFLVHFYMPGEVGIDIPVNIHVDNQDYSGMFRPRFCPTLSGCRGLITFDDDLRNKIIGGTDGKIRISFNNTSGKTIWVDYVLIIPSSSYDSKHLNLQPIDHSVEFLKECIGPGFELINNSQFCKDGVFTLTTDFNNGAISCDCNYDGSLSFDCNQFGGQCQCRQNVIGRRCELCEEGYYGFPRCTKCDCPFGTCHPLTGDCICPPNVVGARCDQCAPATYGYDSLVGCTECKCNIDGIVYGDLNCDQTTGGCNCKENIINRKCDHCKIGYHTFPACEQCNCNELGTIETVCDAMSGQCECKTNVAPPYCDRCQPGSYHLDPRNPKGCLECFCFGTTRTCQSTVMYWDDVEDMSNWDVTNVQEGALREAGTIIAVLDAVNKTIDPNQPMYWIAPAPYLGNKLRSYGGKLKFQSIYMLPREDPTISEQMTANMDVIIKGHNMTIYHTFTSVPQPSTMFNYELEISENKFRDADTELSITREQLYDILIDVDALHIVANHYSSPGEARLMEVKMEYATEDGAGEQAVSVEQCQCPVGYTGTSCESCETGFYRIKSTPYLGTCVPCRCNGHADTCDSLTGVCETCRDNTFGDHCDQCLPGHYGDPATEPCRICSCPIASASNNFATSCDVYNGQLYSCQCKEGYTGTYCERCAPGYFGNPSLQGSTCQPCQCSGNIDMNDPYACDVATGECLRCLNNTVGPQCNQCRDWYYGDALQDKDCAACQCDQCGSEYCERDNGQCTCKPNVIGLGCEQCAPNTYGFDQCGGCRDCNCEVASVSAQCDMVSGDCNCQPGVEGRFCDVCIEGYWNYAVDGCQKCNCEFDGAITCDRQSGRCQCLPGVTGPTCDRCLDRWVLIPQKGCQECDNCVHILIDDVEALDSELGGLTANLAGVSAGVSAHNRLKRINESVIALGPEVADLYSDPRDLELTPLRQELSELEIQANNGNGKASSLVITGDAVQEESSRLLESALETEGTTNELDQIRLETVQYIENVLERILQGIKLTNISNYVTVSQQIMDEIISRNFSKDAEECNAEKMAAITMTFSLRGYVVKTDNGANHTTITRAAVDRIGARLYDLQNGSRLSVLDAEDAINMAEDIRTVLMATLQSTIDDIKMHGSDTEMVLEMSRDLIEKALVALQHTKNWTKELEENSSKMDDALVKLSTRTDSLVMGIAMSEGPVNQSIAHANSLEEQARFLESMYTDSRDSSSNAINAAQSYGDIVMAIDDAYDAAILAVNASDEAFMKSNGVGVNSAASKNQSMILLEAAKTMMTRTEQELSGRLEDAKQETEKVKDLNAQVSNELNEIQGDLPFGNVGQRAQDAQQKATDAEQKAINARNKISTILSKLPEDKRKVETLATDTVNTNKATNDAMEQITYVSENVPQIEKLVNDLNVQKNTVQDLQDRVIANITELKEKIKLARDEANRIRVGLEFLGNTTVTLRNPENINEAGSFTRLSMYIQTTQKDALLAYVGGDHIPGRPVVPDYMSVELRNGQTVFRFNLGAQEGPTEIVHPWDLSDGGWYNIIAERIGKVGTLTLRKENDLGNVDVEDVKGEAQGTFTVLELDPDTTKFYVGGVPYGVSLPPGIGFGSYQGIMEEVMWDERPMGLWNFVDGENNYVGAQERNKLTGVISNGFRFDGRGYVTVSAKAIGFKPNKGGDLILKFKTYSQNGLILYMGKNRDFVSLEMRDGHVFYQYDLGGMPAKLMSNKTYNDGQWHTIEAQRIETEGYLKVDGSDGVSGFSPGNLKELAYEDSIFIGGYNEFLTPVDKYVSSIGFDGCVKDVQFDATIWDLNKNTRALGVLPGCPAKIRRTANFASTGHVAMVTDSIGENFDVTFKMKTLTNNSLLLYAGNNAKDEVFSVSVVNGRIIVTSDAGNDLTTIESDVSSKYNDGEWHYLSLMKMGKKLMMNIDDREMVNRMSKGDDSSVTTNPVLYFGGFDGILPDALVGSTSPFVGCISDVTVNNKFLNFASIPNQNVRGAKFSDCPMVHPGAKIEEPVIRTTPAPSGLTSPAGPEEPAQCVLPNPTSLGAPSDMGEGHFFGKSPYSYFEYDQLPSGLRVKSEFEVRLKTTSGNGVVFYASDVRHTDFLSLFMKEGNIIFSFDCGTGEAVIASPQTYNDGQWHTVKFMRNLKQGAMEIDGQRIIEGDGLSKGSARSLNVKPPYYVGGMPDNKEYTTKVGRNLMGVSTAFQGCIADLTLSGKPMPTPIVENDVRRCYTANYESGSFFFNNGGYVQLDDTFSVGVDITISLEVRPRSLTGVLLSVHADNGGDFLLLQMVNGELILTADNGGGEFSTRYTPQVANKLCDSQWHKIEATKAKNVLLMKVDGEDVPHGEGKPGSSSAETKNPLYIGGVPDFERDGMLADSNLIGCMRNLMIDDKPRYISGGVANGDVNLDACPVN